MEMGVSKKKAKEVLHGPYEGVDVFRCLHVDGSERTCESRGKYEEQQDYNSILKDILKYRCIEFEVKIFPEACSMCRNICNYASCLQSNVGLRVFERCVMSLQLVIVLEDAVKVKMHVVRLLYNYYHRKKNPNAEFVEYETFCKLAVVARPLLVWFLNLTKPSQIELNARTDQLLSLTEKAIQNACNTAITLDTSLDEPNINDWPESKVVILLVDLEDNCRLLFGKITEGVWSPFEKEIAPRQQTLEEKLVRRGKNSLTLWSYENKLRLIAYGIVKDITDQAMLKVLL